MTLFVSPLQTEPNLNGIIAAGWKYRFFEAGTTTPKTVYSDPALTTSIGVYAESSANGRFPAIFLNGTYKVTLEDADGTEQWTVDNFDPSASLIASGGVIRIANTTALRATKGIVNRQIASLYIDGVGQVLPEWDASSTLADNGYNVFQVTGVPTGRWIVRDIPQVPALAVLMQLDTTFVSSGSRIRLLCKTTPGDCPTTDVVLQYGDFSSEVAANNGYHGVVIPAADDPTGSTKAWVRSYLGPADIRFWCAGDNSTNDSPSFISALSSNLPLHWADGVYTKLDDKVQFSGNNRRWSGDNRLSCGIRCGVEGDWTLETTGATNGFSVSDMGIFGIGFGDFKQWGLRAGASINNSSFYNVDFNALRRSFRLEGNAYGTHFSKVRYRDCVEGFTDPGFANSDETTWTGCHTWNVVYTFLEMDVDDSAGFVVGETITGATSADTCDIVAIEGNKIIGSQPDGTNASPGIIDFEVGETVSGAVGSATITAVTSCKSVDIENPSGSVTFSGCHNNNTHWKFKDCPNLQVTGGYNETYNRSHPGYDLINCSGFVAVGVLPGSFAYVDESSYRNVAGRIVGADRFTGPTETNLGGNIFPFPLCDNDAVLNAVSGTGTEAIDGVSGKLRVGGTTTSQYKQFVLPAASEGVGVYIKITAITGDCLVNIQNGASLSAVTIANGETKTVRITTLQDGGSIAIRIKGNTVATWEAEILEWDVRPVKTIIGTPVLGKYKAAFVSTTAASEAESIVNSLINAGFMAAS